MVEFELITCVVRVHHVATQLKLDVRAGGPRVRKQVRLGTRSPTFFFFFFLILIDLYMH